jgi:SEC-C motif-containing protein
MTLCPCDSGKPYSKCCEVFHSGTPAPTAEALMRSRYSAYALASQNLALTDYLLQTWHPETRPENLSLNSDESTKWLGLQVKRHQVIDAENAIVEFVARYKHTNNLGGKAERLHETSRFKLIDKRWHYLDGDYQ